MNEEWLSAHLDGELSPSERHELEAALAADPDLREIHDDLARVRAVLRSAPVDVPADAFPRIMAAVEAADPTDAAVTTDVESSAAVVAFPSRRRVPTFAAVAAAAVIITGVVGGLGGSTTVAAFGELIAQHEAAAAVIEGEPMPDDADVAMGDMDPMPMDDASAAALPMPADYSMAQAYRGDHIIHLVYRDRDGEPVSVFRHEGEVDTSDLGDDPMMSSDEADLWSAPIDGRQVAVVDGTGYVWIVVGAAPHETMMDDLMHDLPTRTPSMGERLRDAADAAVEPFRIWD